MQTTFCRYVRITPVKPWVRAFSWSSQQYQLSRPIRSTKFVETLRKETREPVWRLIEALHTRKHPLELSEALADYAISSNEFKLWKPILYEPDIGSAIATLQAHGFVTRAPQSDVQGRPPSSPQPPSWIVLYLAGFKVRTPQQAMGPLLDLVHAHLDVAPTNIRGPLLIFAALNLARFNILLPLRQVVDTFFNIPPSSPSLQFNLLLQAIACNPTRSVENANLVVSILKTMNSRQLNLYPSTYGVLLQDRFIVLQLTKYLRERMIQEGVVPKASHLEAYLRMFSKDGAIHDAQRYYNAIHTPPVDQKPLPEGNTEDSASPSLLAKDDQASAFGFLNNLVTPERLRRDVITHRRLLKPPSYPKEPTNIFDFTTTLSVAARDLSIKEESLIKTFTRTQVRPSLVRPTVATYTVLIRGLLLRNSRKAETYWNELVGTGLPIDKEALSVGLQALTHAGKPHEAFSLLEKHAARISPSVPGVYQVHRPIPLTSTTINDFLIALNRIKRPDVVFKLWDHMSELYGVFPDSRSLTILLQSACIAARLDDSFSGAMAQLALKNPFRTLPPKLTTRESIVADIKATLGDRKKGVKRYVSGIWDSQSAMEGARKVFLQAIFGNAPTQLFDVVSPAHAVRTSVDADAMPTMGLPRIGPKKILFTPPADLLTPDGNSRYPHIVVTNENCIRYIILLGTMSRAAEIPLTLSWMRKLDIQPTKVTLAVALVFWSEISVQAPLIEAWSGGPERNEYTRLVEWLKEWVGPRRMPTERLLERWQQNIARMRENR